MKIVDQRPSGRVRMPLRDVPIGTVFSGQIASKPSTFLATFSGAVDLNNPSATWSRTCGVDIHNYAPLTVELVIKGEID